MSDTITRPAPPAAIRALTETVRGRIVTASDSDHVEALHDPDSLVHVNHAVAPANGR